MFTNIGDTICKIAKVLFFLFLICGIIMFFIFGSTNYFELEYVIYGIVDGLLTIFIGEIFIALPLYGFGKLINDVQSIKYYLSKHEQ